MPRMSQDFKKVTKCLYRNGKKLYYGVVKLNGKPIRRLLKTAHLAIAKQRLVGIPRESRAAVGEENRSIRFEKLADE